MRHVLYRVEVLIMSGNFDPAFPTSRTVVVQRARIVECPAVHVEMVVVEPFIERSRRGAGPSAVLAFYERSAAATSEVHCDTLGLRRLAAKPRITLGADLRLLLAQVIHGR